MLLPSDVTDIPSRRLVAQRLAGGPFASAIEAVHALGAVQSQDYPGAKWAVGQRVSRTNDADLDRLFDDGTILRTHVMRPTWHFVLPQDIRWLIDLTGPRVRAGMAGRHRALEMDSDQIARASDAFASALVGGHQLTRVELGEVLRGAGIAPDGQRLPHFLNNAELDGLVTSGPRRGKEFTYALLEERAPHAQTLDREHAVVELTRRYFSSHGPAQVSDFTWWSGLTAADARAGIAGSDGALAYEKTDGKTYYFDAAVGQGCGGSGPRAHLLPNFDEYTVGYRDRSAAVHPDRPFDPGLFSFGSILSNVVLIDGRVRGSWRRVTTAGSVRVEVRLLEALRPSERDALDAAVEAFGRFLARPVEIRTTLSRA